MKNGKLKGQENIFSTADYIKELEQICETNKISLDLINIFPSEQIFTINQNDKDVLENINKKLNPVMCIFQLLKNLYAKLWSYGMKIAFPEVDFKK